MELTDILIDLSNSKAALMAANQTIRRLNGKCMRKNLVIIGLAWLSMKACTMLGESEKKRKDAENEARGVKAELEHMQLSYDQLFRETQNLQETDICCDGKASVTKKNV